MTTTNVEDYINNIKIKIEKVTPEAASAILERHFKKLETEEFKQRKITQSKVDQYSTDIAHDTFLLTHQGIAFDRADNLIDGQHRLMAIRLAMKPIWLMVSRGWPEGPVSAGGLSVMDTIDRGRPRDLVQALQLSHGYSYVDAKTLGVTTRFMIEMILGATGLRIKKAITVPQVLSALKIFEPHLRAVALLSKNVQRIPKRPWAVLGFAHKSHPKEVDEFARKMFSLVGLKDNDPALLLHRYTALQVGRRGVASKLHEYQVAGQLLRAHIEKKQVLVARPNPEALQWLLDQQDDSVDQIVDLVTTVKPNKKD